VRIVLIDARSDECFPRSRKRCAHPCSEVLNRNVVCCERGRFPLSLSFSRNSISSSVAVPLRDLSLRNSFSPGSPSEGWSGSFSTNSNFLGCPGLSLWFNESSERKVYVLNIVDHLWVGCREGLSKAILTIFAAMVGGAVLTLLAGFANGREMYAGQP
jgi:hypothetical protein